MYASYRVCCAIVSYFASEIDNWMIAETETEIQALQVQILSLLKCWDSLLLKKIYEYYGKMF